MRILDIIKCANKIQVGSKIKLTCDIDYHFSGHVTPSKGDIGIVYMIENGNIIEEGKFKNRKYAYSIKLLNGNDFRVFDDEIELL